MALHRRRRIFSGGLAARQGGGEMRRGLVATMAAVLLLTVGAVMLQPAQLYGRAPAMTGTVAVPAAQVAVVDGQTLRLGEAVVRLQGVAAPARGMACLRPDNSRFDCGAATADALAQLLRGMAVSCKWYGRDAAGFLHGLCEAEGRDVNRQMVASGWARARSETPGFAAASFSDAESQARAAHRRLWQGGGVSF